MNRKFKTKRKVLLKKKDLLIGSFLLIVILVYIFLRVLGDIINPIILKYSEREVKRFATNVVTSAINDDVINELDIDDLFTVIKNDQEEIQTIDFNPQIVNSVLQKSIEAVQHKINDIDDGNLDNLSLPSSLDNIYLDQERGTLLLEVPLGIVANNAILTNIGPKIPMKLGFIGEVVGNVKTTITEYGINNALVKVTVEIEVTEQIIMPLITEEIPVTIEVVLAIKMIQGKVPTYYQNGLQENSSMYSLPLT